MKGSYELRQKSLVPNLGTKTQKLRISLKLKKIIGGRENREVYERVVLLYWCALVC